jgi:4-hydroxy-tetrahydrodipicolinate reductase
MSTRVILAGATGWAGGELARGIAAADDLELAGAVGRRHAGEALGRVLGEPRLRAVVRATAGAALAEGADVFVEYTAPESAKGHVLAALEAGLHVVVGTSGLTDGDYEDIDRAARARRRGVLACGNFSLTAALLQRYAEAAARHLPQFEIVEYGADTKRDAPSGTVRELTYRLAQARRPTPTVPLDETRGARDARGATLNGVQVHALRLPGPSIGFEAVFGLPDERLLLRHDAGGSARPYVDGALLAIRKVNTLTGVHRGLDRVMPL